MVNGKSFQVQMVQGWLNRTSSQEIFAPKKVPLLKNWLFGRNICFKRYMF